MPRESAESEGSQRPKLNVFHVAIPNELNRKLTEISDDYGKKKTDLVRQAISEFVKNHYPAVAAKKGDPGHN